MNISQPWKWIVGVIGSIGTLITGIKSIAEAGSGLWRNLNPWHVTFCLFAVMLLALGVVYLLEKLDARFVALHTEMTTKFTNEASARGGEHFAAWTEFGKLEKRIAALEAEALGVQSLN